MAVIMMMAINAQLFSAARAEHGDKFRVHGDHFRRAGAADMVVQAQHFVGFCHHQMQVVRNHQHRAISSWRSWSIKVQRNLAVDVNTLGRFIQHQQLRLLSSAGQQNALRFTAGEFCIGASIRCPPARVSAPENIGFTRAGTQAQETAHRQRQRGVQVNFCGT
jgi:hypothetical protein